MRRLAIVTTHPIQYNAPVFKLLTDRAVIDVKVFYTWGNQVLSDKYDPGFGKIIDWDIPLLDGYDHIFVKNEATNQGSHHFYGIVNPDLVHSIDTWNPHAVLVYGWNFQSHLTCMRHYSGRIPVLFRGDSTLLDIGRNTIKSWMRTRFLTWVYRHVDFCLFAGTANKNYFVNAGVRPQSLIRLPHTVDNERFGAAMKQNFRLNLGIPSDSLVFLFAGKFIPKKSPETLLYAFSELPSDKTHLILAGNGLLERKIHSLIDSFDENIRGRIHVVGFQNQRQMPDLYKCCDIFVLPSTGPGETWGLSINEAMASGKAVIASNKCGSCFDLIVENENGFVFEAGDKNTLRVAMDRFIHDPGLARQFGRKSLELIEAYSPEKFCSALEEILLNQV
jgi:glycosyltransferase involved in cell wall biosynthesis